MPTLSIVREGADNYVFVYNNGIAERRKIELGRLNELEQEVLSGVQEGELLIVTGQHQLTDGEQVELEHNEYRTEGLEHELEKNRNCRHSFRRARSVGIGAAGCRS